MSADLSCQADDFTADLRGLHDGGAGGRSPSPTLDLVTWPLPEMVLLSHLPLQYPSGRISSCLTPGGEAALIPAKKISLGSQEKSALILWVLVFFFHFL